MKSFYELRTWQEEHALSLEVYRITSSFPSSEQFGLISQLRRASISVTSNIAEGMGRNTKKDFVRFLYQARGSIYEILSQLALAKDLNYLVEQDYNKLVERYDGLSIGLNRHIFSLLQSS